MTTDFPSNTNNTQAIDLWLLDIDQFTSRHFIAAENIMSNDERERATKLLRGKGVFIASRWLLRKVLSTYTKTSPTELDFKRTPKGKPYLEGHGIEFSLSHSDHWALLAVSKKNLGADIEVPQKTRDLPGIAQSFFHPLEYARLKELDGPAQQDYFFRLWTLKEAFLKAIGTGISAGLDKVHFHGDGNSLRAELSPELQQDWAAPWQFFHAQKLPGLYLALAYQSPIPLVINWCNPLDLSSE